MTTKTIQEERERVMDAIFDAVFSLDIQQLLAIRK